jgi:putative ABC transport system substrate-binding protein
VKVFWSFENRVGREFITIVGGAAIAWPLDLRAQESAMPVIGLLSAGTPESDAKFMEAFRAGLAGAGYIEGRNVTFVQRWARSELERLPELAADLVRLRVAVIVTLSSTAAALAAKAATRSIQIVFMSGGDPVTLGLVASMTKPEGNITGMTYFNPELESKRFELLHQLVPNAERYAVLVNLTGPLAQSKISALKAATSASGRQIEIFNAVNTLDIDTAFARLIEWRAAALLVPADILFLARRQQLVSLAVQHSVPALYSDRTFAEAGGLMSYGPSYPDLLRQVGTYAGRIIKGEKPADLPVEQLRKFDFVINLKTAKALGLDVSQQLRSLANKVIE